MSTKYLQPSHQAPLEQPDDWTKPGAHPALPDLWRIPLPLPGTGLRAVNVYLCRGPEGLTLVDSGWASPQTHIALEHGLATLGHTSAEITRIVVTHDHYTYALALRATHPFSVMLGRGEQATVETFTQASPPTGRHAPSRRRPTAR